MSTGEQNKAIVRECFARAAQGDFDALGDIVSPTFVLHPGDVRGAEGLADMVRGYRRTLAGLTVTVEHQFAEGDYVATRATIRGRHDGELMGTPPTGRDVAFSCLTISRCRDGRIEEEWEIGDLAGLLQQVGAAPAMAQA